MSRYETIDSTSVYDHEGNTLIKIGIGLPSFEYEQWLNAGNVPRPIKPSNQYIWDETSSNWIESIEIVREKKINEIIVFYENTFSLSVDCMLSDSTTIIPMNNGKIHAQTLKSGYDLAVLNDETSMNIVDFYDVVHTDVSLTDVQEIMKQQGLAARQDWEQKVTLKQAALDATSIEQIDLISWE